MSSALISKRDALRTIELSKKAIAALGVRRLGLFGSVVRDEATSQSDVDLIVEFQKGKKNFDRFMRLSFLLEELLSHSVELVTSEALSPHLGAHILKEAEFVEISS